MRLVFTVSAIIMCAAGPAQSQPQTNESSPCEAAQTQLELNECSAKALGVSDRKLNQLYRTVEGRLAGDADARGLLVDAQRRWIAFRDAECAFRTSAVQGGSIEPMVRSLCLTSLTDARITDLENLLSCEEGDTSCPVPPG
ncbi:lysozyme inhibitor LprI family protein [Aureimonas altamirensis]|uniref:lysozyme inhibitor LprI family protein n=1 Tax=Aureimonas altamirensis TaxID=370622 RepID=UPI001E4D6FE5|nr:lysozyme inhibitor LprI family protein [Aureimonas altamirensis]UHD46523.1 lysozyme inhibitor LprI family protein [Aureimonas altamirensis]